MNLETYLKTIGQLRRPEYLRDKNPLPFHQAWGLNLPVTIDTPTKMQVVYAYPVWDLVRYAPKGHLLSESQFAALPWAHCIPSELACVEISAWPHFKGMFDYMWWSQYPNRPKTIRGYIAIDKVVMNGAFAPVLLSRVEKCFLSMSASDVYVSVVNLDRPYEWKGFGVPVKPDLPL